MGITNKIRSETIIGDAYELIFLNHLNVKQGKCNLSTTVELVWSFAIVIN